MDSASGIPASILSGKKFKIQQSVPTGSIKRGPHTIVRTADLNDGIEIKRRFGEGSKPLFADIPIKQAPGDSHGISGCKDISSACKLKSNRRSSSTESSSPERYRHRESKKNSSPVASRRKSPGRTSYNERPTHSRDKHVFSSKFDSSKTDKYRRTEKSKSRSPSPLKKKPAEKIPYYRDERREKDRLRRLYGHSCSRSPPSTSRRRDSPIAKRRIESQLRRRRSTSRERYYRRSSPHRSLRRDFRRHRSRTPSKTRSPQRHERPKNSIRNLDKEQIEDANSLSSAVIPATPQYIPIPVPVPADYAPYSFAGWTPPQLPWHTTPHRPPSASPFVPFPMWPMVPPIRPPRQASFAGMPPPLGYNQIAPQYRPHASQRYQSPRHHTNNYQSRP